MAGLARRHDEVVEQEVAEEVVDLMGWGSRGSNSRGEVTGNGGPCIHNCQE